MSPSATIAAATSSALVVELADLPGGFERGLVDLDETATLAQCVS